MKLQLTLVSEKYHRDHILNLHNKVRYMKGYWILADLYSLPCFMLHSTNGKLMFPGEEDVL